MTNGFAQAVRLGLLIWPRPCATQSEAEAADVVTATSRQLSGPQQPRQDSVVIRSAVSQTATLGWDLDLRISRGANHGEAVADASQS
jgi:hypothetical protein